eukprot:107421-Chlamydomonas_euryale.AAC.10
MLSSLHWPAARTLYLRMQERGLIPSKTQPYPTAEKSKGVQPHERRHTLTLNQGILKQGFLAADEIPLELNPDAKNKDAKVNMDGKQDKKVG